MNPLHLLLLVSQIADATTSANVLTKGLEMNPAMRPFSHGGPTTMLVGEVFFDTVQESAAQRWSVGQRNNLTVFFIVEHALCAIHNTNQLRLEGNAGPAVQVPLAKF